MPSLTKVNRSAATLTKNRTEDSIVPPSGMCVTCVDAVSECAKSVNLPIVGMK